MAGSLHLPAALADADETRQRGVMERAAAIAREMLGMEMSYIAATRGDRLRWECVVGDGESFGVERDASVPLDETYCGRMLARTLDNLVRDSSREPVAADLPMTEHAKIGAYIGVPVVLSDGEVYGTFCCVNHEPVPDLRERDVRFLHVLAQLVAHQLDEERRLEEVRRLEVAGASVGALLAGLAARDGYTEEHSVAVVELALAVGRRLALGANALADLESAALLHDIGKMGVPDAILRKPEKLAPEEWAEMRRHPEIGARIVGSMPALSHLAPVIRAEHERWDGGGYPDGLAGPQIPLGARIVLVCDAYHAMTSDRPYRAAMSREDAVAEIEHNIGAQFCPSSAQAMLAVIAASSAAGLHARS